MEVLRIAMAQINPVVGDLQGNVKRIVEAVDKANKAGADIVLAPELSLCGYPPEDLLLKPGFLKNCRKALEDLVKQVDGTTAIVGFPEVVEKDVYNAAAVISNQRLAGVYRKIELPNYGVFDEKRYFKAGKDCLLVRMGGSCVMVTICEDIWIPGALPEIFAREGRVNVVLNISASPFNSGKRSERREIVSRFAKASGAFVFYDNLVGGQDELVFDGGSLVMDPGGHLIASAKSFEEDLLVTDIEVDNPSSGQTMPSREFDHEIEVIEVEARSQKKIKRTSPTKARELDNLEEIYRALVLGTRDYVKKNGFEKAVIGLSGGIDSALTACIAVEALGVENVIGVTMPSQYTSAETRSDAALLAGNLKVPLITVPIIDIFTSYLEKLSPVFGGGEPGVENENLQARIRGNILMALSNRFGWLVLTTGNKSETAVGYATLYGDMAGGFSVIKDLPKTLVYELAEYLNQRAGYDLIPRSVIERPPTAELKPGQKDEDSLPPYPSLDPILHAYIEEDKSYEEMVAEGYEPEVVAKIIRMVDRSEYKRRQAPPGVKITPRAFGKDRRLPITNHCHP